MVSCVYFSSVQPNDDPGSKTIPIYASVKFSFSRTLLPTRGRRDDSRFILAQKLGDFHAEFRRIPRDAFSQLVEFRKHAFESSRRT